MVWSDWSAGTYSGASRIHRVTGGLATVRQVDFNIDPWANVPNPETDSSVYWQPPSGGAACKLVGGPSLDYGITPSGSHQTFVWWNVVDAGPVDDVTFLTSLGLVQGTDYDLAPGKSLTDDHPFLDFETLDFQGWSLPGGMTVYSYGDGGDPNTPGDSLADATYPEIIHGQVNADIDYSKLSFGQVITGAGGAVTGGQYPQGYPTPPVDGAGDDGRVALSGEGWTGTGTIQQGAPGQPGQFGGENTRSNPQLAQPDLYTDYENYLGHAWTLRIGDRRSPSSMFVTEAGHGNVTWIDSWGGRPVPIYKPTRVRYWTSSMSATHERLWVGFSAA